MSGSAAGLPISNVVEISVVISPSQAPLSNFGSLLVIGSSGVIPFSQRLRMYTSYTQVLGDFSATTPEAIAAGLFFDQSPQPGTLYIGQWNQTTTPAILIGGYINPANQGALLASLNAVTSGAFTISINGVSEQINIGSLVNVVSFTQLALLISNALNSLFPGVLCTWSTNNNQFMITGVYAGANSGITYASAPATNTNIATLLNLTQAAGATISLSAAAETPLAAVTAMLSQSLGWYECMFASTALQTTDHMAIAELIEAASPPRIYGITDQNPAELSPTDNSTIGYLTYNANFERTIVQFSSTSPYAIASLFGIGDTVDFTANNTVLTLNGKNQPGLTAETLTLSQALQLASKNVNYFVKYQTGSAILQNGTMANGYYFDEVQGSDWLANDVQTRLFNRIINTTTKIPQTDAGVTLLKNDAESACADAVNNGLVGPGTWEGPTIGSLVTGAALPSGYYVYAPPIASQAPSVRQARIAPTLQICVCFAGAIQKANGIINVQR